MEIGERLKHLRIENGFLQSDIAERCNVSRGAVSAWECNRAEPNIGQIKILAKLYDVTPSFLIGETDQNVNLIDFVRNLDDRNLDTLARLAAYEAEMRKLRK